MSARLQGRTQSISLFIDSYNFSLQLESKKSQTRRGSVSHPIRGSQTPLNLTLDCLNEEYFATLQTFVRQSQLDAIDYTSLLRFTWPEQQMDYQGVITEFGGGGTRFEFAPVVQMKFLLVKDLIHTIPGYVSNPDGLGQMEDLYNDFGSSDPVEDDVLNNVDNKPGPNTLPNPFPIKPTFPSLPNLSPNNNFGGFNR